jgi:hypothetical protein
MREINREVDTKVVEGKLVRIFRNYFIYEKTENLMAKAHAYFTRDQKKQAKLQYKLNK